VPDEPALIINEIMYNSPGTDEEWVELFNNTGASIDLENWKLLDSDASHTPIVIPAGYSIDDGGYFTIAVATGGSFPFTPDYDGTGNFALNNSGDVVRLYNNSGILIDNVSYTDSDPWPTEPDGDGPTLSLIDPNTDNSLPQSWLASLEEGGTPGAENFPPIPFVDVTSPSGGEYIEQGADFEITWSYGFWDGIINIELLKEGQDPEPIVYNIPLSDGSFMWTVLANQELGDDYKVRISGIEDGDPVGESADYFSIIEPYVLPNIVITEIMYNPPESGDDSLEFLEFYNNSAETISMDNFTISQGVEYTFPSGIEIMPDTFLLVAKDSVAMMATFGVEALQWTSGSLSNGGEGVELKDDFDYVVDYVPYDDYLPWDTLADGFGPSLTLCNPDADNTIAENWRASENFAAINSAGDTIWATPGFECQISLIAGFTSDKQFVIVGDSVMFTDQSSGDPSSWNWTFEGGMPETFEGQNPPYILYEQEGVWDVTLVISDGVNTDSLTYQNYIHSGYAPVADFEADDTQITAGSYTNFTSLSTGDNLSFEWIFEGGTPETSTEENPTEIYYLIMDWDYYDVTLVVSNEFGSDSLIKDDYIEVIPENVNEKILTNQNVKLFPNPNDGNFTISIPASADAEVNIIDLQGRSVLYDKISGSQQINVKSIERGIYIVKIFDTESGSQVIKRLIIR
jgi:PKD repeat protein